jgi:hypothetical protein
LIRQKQNYFALKKQTMLRCRNAILYLSLIDRNKFQQEGVGSLLGFFLEARQELSQDFTNGESLSEWQWINVLYECD